MTEVLFEHVVGGRYERSEITALLRLKIQDVLHAATGEDWEAIAKAYAVNDGDLDPAEIGASGAGRVHEFDGTRFDVGLLREFLATVLADPMSADRIAEETSEAGGLEAPPPMIAEGLRSAAAGALRAASEEDWNAVTEQLIAQAREIEGEGQARLLRSAAPALCAGEPNTRARASSRSATTAAKVARSAKAANSRSL